jgi:hypothetical protein
MKNRGGSIYNDSEISPNYFPNTQTQEAEKKSNKLKCSQEGLGVWFKGA